MWLKSLMGMTLDGQASVFMTVMPDFGDLADSSLFKC